MFTFRREKTYLIELQTRFDEVDEAVPDKKLTIHEILLKGKRANRLPFEDELRPPGGNLTNSIVCEYFCSMTFICYECDNSCACRKG
mgnify:FL=1